MAVLRIFDSSSYHVDNVFSRCIPSLSIVFPVRQEEQVIFVIWVALKINITLNSIILFVSIDSFDTGAFVPDFTIRAQCLHIKVYRVIFIIIECRWAFYLISANISQLIAAFSTFFNSLCWLCCLLLVRNRILCLVGNYPLVRIIKLVAILLDKQVFFDRIDDWGKSIFNLC